MSASRLGSRAVIAGGSLAGMLSARALSPHFDEIVVLERDTFGNSPAPRATVPQSAHLHMLLKGGENAIERMLPGFRAQIENSGSVQIRGRDFLSGSDLGVAPRRDSPLVMHGQSRWMLEYCVRSSVLAQVPNLDVHTNVSGRGLRYEREHNRVTGIDVQGPDGPLALDADLVIDATGRSEVGLRWMRALDIALPEVEEVEVDFGYSSVTVRLAPDPSRDWKGLVSGNLPRVGARGAVISPIEDGLHICSMGGRADDHPPAEREAFLDFAKSLPQPTIYEALQASEFVSEIARMQYPANRFRHYERLESLPAGLLPVGDALCSFNPTYGQGMSSAALQAEVLCDVFAARETHEHGGDVGKLGRRYLERAAEVAQMPWRQACFNDFLYPTTRGDRSMFSDDETRYRIALQMAAMRDDVVRDLSGQVSQLLIPFERLLEDDVRERVEAAGTPPPAQAPAD